MEQYKILKICVVLFALILLNKAAVVGPNFPHALQLIKPPINYDAFCVQKAAGGDKIACRIKAEPTVGLLICKAAIVDGAACQDVINTELHNLAKLRVSGVRTVTFHEKPINGLNCGEKPAEVCSGFLEEWVGEDRGKFEHIRDAIAKHTLPALIQKVKGYTSRAGLAATAADLMTIKAYMEAGATKYRQICDLQGFFLINGGFLVNDVPDISERIGLQDRCWEDPADPEPTTQEVLTALDAMIKAF